MVVSIHHRLFVSVSVLGRYQTTWQIFFVTKHHTPDTCDYWIDNELDVIKNRGWESREGVRFEVADGAKEVRVRNAKSILIYATILRSIPVSSVSAKHTNPVPFRWSDVASTDFHKTRGHQNLHTVLVLLCRKGMVSTTGKWGERGRS